MRIHIVAVGQRAPAWVQAGFEHYAQRLPAALRPRLQHIPLARRADKSTRSSQRARDEEGQRILKRLPLAAHVVALHVAGTGWSTRQLCERVKLWQRAGRDVYFVIGGPDGLSGACLERADELWSLSALTLPHALVRVVLAEALYRAWSIDAGHPYHRE